MSAQAWAPAVDITERKDAYLVTAELPGVGIDDLEITFQDGVLTIQGQRHATADSSEERVHRAERRYGAFRRSITLPAHVKPTRSTPQPRTACCRSWYPRRRKYTPSASRCAPGAGPRPHSGRRSRDQQLSPTPPGGPPRVFPPLSPGVFSHRVRAGLTPPTRRLVADLSASGPQLRVCRESSLLTRVAASRLGGDGPHWMRCAAAPRGAGDCGTQAFRSPAPDV